MTESSYHNEYPILSVFFTTISGSITYFMNHVELSKIDASFIAPMAHLAAFGSGCIAIILGLISIYERYFKKKKKAAK